MHVASGVKASIHGPIISTEECVCNLSFFESHALVHPADTKKKSQSMDGTFGESSQRVTFSRHKDPRAIRNKEHRSA